MALCTVLFCLLLLCCLCCVHAARPEPRSLTEGSAELSQSTSGLKQQVEDFLHDTATHKDDIENVTNLKGDDRQQLKDDLNKAFWTIDYIEQQEKQDPAFKAAQKKAAAEKQQQDAAAKKHDGFFGFGGFGIVLFCCVICACCCDMKNNVSSEQQSSQHQPQSAQAAAGTSTQAPAAVPNKQNREGQINIHNNITSANGAAAAADKSRSGAQPDPMFLCPITHDVMRDPVIAADGHTYERQALQQWLLSHNTSPVTNQPLAYKRLIPNHCVRSAIMEWQAKQGGIDA